nr:hypothetical protein [Tanacetum cinerariifolium]
TMGTHDDEAKSSRSKRSRQYETVEEVLLPQVHHEFLLWEGCNRDAKSRLGLFQAVELDEEGFNVYFEGGLRNDEHFNAQEYWKSRVLMDDVIRSLSALIYYRDLDTTTIRDLIDSEGRLIPKDPQPGVPIVGIPRPPRASMQDLYDKMGRKEIRQEAIKRMEYRQSYHWDRYLGLFENMAGVYSVLLQGAYNPPSFAQPQYDQYYQQYPPLPP